MANPNAMPRVQAVLDILSTGAMPAASEFGDAFRDLVGQITDVRNNLTGHVTENTQAHETFSTAIRNVADVANGAHQMVASIEGPFNELRSLIGQVGDVQAHTQAATAAAASTLLQRIVSLEETANVVTGTMQGQIDRLVAAAQPVPGLPEVPPGLNPSLESRVVALENAMREPLRSVVEHVIT